MNDTTIKKVSERSAPKGATGQTYVVSGKPCDAIVKQGTATPESIRSLRLRNDRLCYLRTR